MNHHTIAAISLTGSGLDVLGSLYLAYDLLGGQHGPLRLLTRAVTYSIVFGVGYGIGLGLFFGLACGVATGITVAVELQRQATCGDHYPLPMEALFSAIRGAAFAAGLVRVTGLSFAVAFGLLITSGQIVGYAAGTRPAMALEGSGLGTMARVLRASVLRALGYILAALVCGATVHHLDHIWTFALRVGTVTGLVTTAGTAAIPYIEYYADRLPERRMGVLGIVLLLGGFALQSLQYWLGLFDIRVG